MKDKKLFRVFAKTWYTNGNSGDWSPSSYAVVATDIPQAYAKVLKEHDKWSHETAEQREKNFVILSIRESVGTDLIP